MWRSSAPPMGVSGTLSICSAPDIRPAWIDDQYDISQPADCRIHRLLMPLIQHGIGPRNKEELDNFENIVAVFRVSLQGFKNVDHFGLGQ